MVLIGLSGGAGVVDEDATTPVGIELAEPTVGTSVGGEVVAVSGIVSRCAVAIVSASAAATPGSPVRRPAWRPPVLVGTGVEVAASGVVVGADAVAAGSRAVDPPGVAAARSVEDRIPPVPAPMPDPTKRRAAAEEIASTV